MRRPQPSPVYGPPAPVYPGLPAAARAALDGGIHPASGLPLAGPGHCASCRFATRAALAPACALRGSMESTELAVPACAAYEARPAPAPLPAAWIPPLPVSVRASVRDMVRAAVAAAWADGGGLTDLQWVATLNVWQVGLDARAGCMEPEQAIAVMGGMLREGSLNRGAGGLIAANPAWVAPPRTQQDEADDAHAAMRAVAGSLWDPARDPGPRL